MGLNKEAIRASWEAERDSIRNYILTRKPHPFNNTSADKFINNFIDSMVFADIPCTSHAGIAAAARQYEYSDSYRCPDCGCSGPRCTCTFTEPPYAG
jgi:hypothetical protein